MPDSNSDSDSEHNQTETTTLMHRRRGTCPRCGSKHTDLYALFKPDPPADARGKLICQDCWDAVVAAGTYAVQTQRIEIEVRPNGLSRLKIDGVEQTNVSEVEVLLRPRGARVIVTYVDVDATIDGEFYLTENTVTFNAPRPDMRAQGEGEGEGEGE